jgi:hypothetical protein
VGSVSLEASYWQAYRDFYTWGSILKAASTHTEWSQRLRHLAYAGGWKKFEPWWDWVIRLQQVAQFRPLLETLLAGSSPVSKVEASEIYPETRIRAPLTDLKG